MVETEQTMRLPESYSMNIGGSDAEKKNRLDGHDTEKTINETILLLYLFLKISNFTIFSLL